jgi:hypothetical protein
MNKILLMNEARKRYRFEHEEEVKEQAIASFENYRNEPLFIAGVMLYWAEGTRIANYRKYQLALTNSEPKLLQVYSNFLRTYFKDIESDLRVGLYIYEDIDESAAKAFWSTQLKIPLNQFIKTQVLPSRSVLTKTKLPYGTCNLYVNSKDYLKTMQIWIDRMSDSMRG